MSRIQTLLEQKKEKLLSIFFTAGYPERNSTLSILKALEKNGADLVELGMPYSDPLADGPVIQESSSQALQNGMSIDLLFSQLQDLRKQVQVPVILMGYLNPVLQYGFEKFCDTAAKLGIDGLIIPDLPPHEYETFYGPIIERNGLDFIFLVTPETPEQRLRKLDTLSRGFLYAVTSSSTTGQQVKEDTSLTFLEKLNGMRLKNAVLAGFGISNRQSVDQVCRYARGAIVGSAFIKAINAPGDLEKNIEQFISSLR